MRNINILGGAIIKKDKRIIILVSEKMLNEFNKKCQEKEITKSEALRECIRKFIKSK